MGLTKEQQKLVEDNRRLIYYAMYKYNLLAHFEQDECYCILAEGLCKAAMGYRTDTAFSTYALKCMLNEALMARRAQQALSRATCTTVSSCVAGDGEEYDLLDALAADEPDFTQALETSEVVRAVVTEFARECKRSGDKRALRDWKMFVMYVDGATREELMKAFSLSKAAVGKHLLETKRALQRRLLEQGIGPRPSTLEKYSKSK